jgi:hypothetical protein
MHSTAFMPLREGWQPMSRLKCECLDQCNLHHVLQDIEEWFFLMNLS